MLVALAAVESSNGTEEKDLADKILAASSEREEASGSTSPQPDIRSSPFVIKQKGRDDELEQQQLQQQQQSRKQAKKSKVKQTMTLDEFCGPPTFEDTARYAGNYKATKK